MFVWNNRRQGEFTLDFCPQGVRISPTFTIIKSECLAHAQVSNDWFHNERLSQKIVQQTGSTQDLNHREDSVHVKETY